MHLRPYTPADASPTHDVFRRAIRGTAAADYTPEQVEAWATVADHDPREWARRRAAASTVVAVDEGRVVGFSDTDAGGYIDMMFVDPSAGGQGVGRALLEAVTDAAARAGATEQTTHASVTARPFFEHFGFVFVAELHPRPRGVPLASSLLRRPLLCPSAPA
ncbi:hypothetical protein AX769_02785 [Frondihabitans sp. PAMC 28766]|uniref:GNAT family N-acetyltransferase n=1 Tax=Frondihabitans sp. PAMC 28766 TaxID=1795630 RepID=UPI00078CA6D6|nr:GNAT family N-acetyltransferase [Frondihabitans sp. PAMC 28766]AMM19253.1 hypothetical protein AX769_02785 [Frondihabitans sp. PAMC 28766]